MKFHCSICAKNVYDKDKAVLYDLCQLWVYVACNTFNYLDYRSGFPIVGGGGGGQHEHPSMKLLQKKAQ